jgi:hypothetical protein
MAPTKSRVQFKELVPERPSHISVQEHCFLSDRFATIEDQYDTFETDPSQPWVQKALFVDCMGQKGKTHAETNAYLCGSLGYPKFAVWKYIRVNFEDWYDLRTVRGFCQRTTLCLSKHDSEIVWRGALSTMQPYLPRGGANKIRSILKQGKIEFWPWLEARLSPTVIRPTDWFHAELTDKHGTFPGKIRGKVILGPYMFRL